MSVLGLALLIVGIWIGVALLLALAWARFRRLDRELAQAFGDQDEERP